jgi:hypothetical protein
MRHQRQFPILADEIAPEAVVRFLANQMKAGRLVDAAGGHQHVVRPQRDLAVARPAGKADAFADQPAANGKPEPTISPSRSAIQQRSRRTSKLSMNVAATRATSASKLSSKPYSSA